MGYQSKTWSLSDEVVAEVEKARGRGDSPNQFLRKLLGLNFGCQVCGGPSVGVVKGVPVFDCKHESQQSDGHPAKELLVELDEEK